jgi:magnesium-protoporphyrin O-methyltransferase
MSKDMGVTAASYLRRMGEIETYFDRTAHDAWKRLVSDQPVSGIRATVRKGRDAMRATLVSWLPADLAGWRILDAGCGSGVLSFELAERGADVLGVDLSARTIEHARQKAQALGRTARGGSATFLSGDMLSPNHGRFDAIISMDALIHYSASDAQDAIEALASRTNHSLLFTLAPQSALLSLMLWAGKAFPSADRSPSIHPVNPAGLVNQVLQRPAMKQWRAARSHRVASGFYTCQAMEVIRT